jgi:hypothetical protein
MVRYVPSLMGAVQAVSRETPLLLMDGMFGTGHGMVMLVPFVPAMCGAAAVQGTGFRALVHVPATLLLRMRMMELMLVHAGLLLTPLLN